MRTGYLARWNDSPSIRAGMVAEGIVWAYRNVDDPRIRARMGSAVVARFGAEEVARRIVALIDR